MNTSLAFAQALWYPSLRVVVLLIFFELLPVAGLHAQTAEPDLRAFSNTDSVAAEQKLMGTAVTSDPVYNLAIVEDQRNRRQLFLHEGDRTGGIIVKKILPGYLVIEVDGSERVVKLGHYLASGTSPMPSEEMHHPTRTTTVLAASRARYRVVDRETVKTALSDRKKVLDNIRISEGHSLNQVKGIRIAGFEPGSIFSKMGLRSGDLLLSINDQEISDPDAISAFLDQVIQGGDLDLTVRRRARTYHINLLIQ